jgi:hypothetical protein
MSNNRAGRVRNIGSSIAVVGVVILVLAAPARADVRWSWSFGTESGTFVTTGTLAQTAGAGVFTFKQFSVSASQVPGNIGATYNEGSQPIQTMSWDGTQPTQFTRDNGVFTNGSNFYRLDGPFFYTLLVPPSESLLVQDPPNTTLVDSPITISPLADVPVAAPALSPAAAGLMMIALLFFGLHRRQAHR